MVEDSQKPAGEPRSRAPPLAAPAPSPQVEKPVEQVIAAGTPIGIMGRDEKSERPVPVYLGLLRGDAESGEPVVPGSNSAEVKRLAKLASAGEYTTEQIVDFIRPLLALAVNTHAMMIAEIKRFRPIPDKDWRLPPGYRVRIAPSYLAWIYSKYSTAKESGLKWMEKRAVQDCLSVRIFLENCCAFDRLLLEDKIEGFVNWMDTEYKTRKCYSLELAFRRATKREHWAKPKDNKAAANWLSLVDWTLAGKVGPSVVDQSEFSLAALEDEVKGVTEREAMLAAARAKLIDMTGRPEDRLNP